MPRTSRFPHTKSSAKVWRPVTPAGENSIAEAPTVGVVEIQQEPSSVRSRPSTKLDGDVNQALRNATELDTLGAILRPVADVHVECESGGDGSEHPSPQELAGFCVGDVVQVDHVEGLGLRGVVRRLLRNAEIDEALVELPGHKVGTARVSLLHLSVVGREGLRVGQRVAWDGADEDIPRGAVGTLLAFWEARRVSVRFGLRRFGFAMCEILDAGPRGGIRTGDEVRWQDADADVPEGSVGTVMGFKRSAGEKACVQFASGCYVFAAAQLKVMRRSTTYDESEEQCSESTTQHVDSRLPHEATSEGNNVIEEQGPFVSVLRYPSHILTESANKDDSVSHATLDELDGFRVGDGVQVQGMGLLGVVRKLVRTAEAEDAVVEFPRSDAGTACVGLVHLRVVARDRLRVGQRVSWRGNDEDVPRGAVGKVLAFRDEGRVSVRFGAQRYGFSAYEMLDAGPKCGVRVGDKVCWASSDEDIPEGSVGTVMGFGLSDQDVACVEFVSGCFSLPPGQLEVTKRCAQYDISDGEHSEPSPGRPPTYPFDNDAHVITFGNGAYEQVRVTLLHGRHPARGVVIFCPGVHGGVGPCRTPGTNYDPNGLFPTLAKALQAEGVSTCRVCWSAMHPSLKEAVRGMIAAVEYTLGELNKRQRPLAGGSVGVCLVGHSLGGAVVLITASALEQRWGLNGKAPGEESGGAVAPAQVRAVCTLAAQQRGAIKAVAELSSIRKLFFHGSSDAVLSSETVKAIHEAALPPKDFCILPGGEHDLYTFKSQLLASVQRFLLEALPRRPQRKRTKGAARRWVWRPKARTDS